MPIETVLVKRRALYVGEIGFFPSNPISEEDVAHARLGEEIVCIFYSPRNLQQLKFLWALVSKVAENSSRWLDKDEAMDDLKLRAGFAKLMFNRETYETTIRPKSLKRIDNEELVALTSKIIDIVCKEIWPGMKPGALRDEIEKMVK
jgi:hypothetical protein